MRDTSEFVAEELIQRVRLGSEDLRLSILEPSAGIGFLADKISENFKGAIIDCVEPVSYTHLTLPTKRIV